MTACAFVHLRNHPAVISDLVVTQRGISHVTPNAVGFVDPSELVPSALARKAFILPGASIFLAFSGDVQGIRDCLSGIATEVRFLNPDRPMRSVGDMINRYVDASGRMVSAVGFALANGSTHVLQGYGNDIEKTEHLNEIAVSGTGSVWLKRKLLEMDSTFTQPDWQETVPFERLVGLLGYINSCSIFEPGTFLADPAFGGYFEALCAADYVKPMRLGNWVHLGYQAEESQSGLTFFPIGKQVTYLPFDRKLFVTLRTPRGLNVSEWRIGTVYPAFDTPATTTTSLDTCTPDFASLFLYFPGVNLKVHRTLTDSELRAAFTREGVVASICSGLLEEIAEKSLKAHSAKQA
jgi:hypothetical protein